MGLIQSTTELVTSLPITGGVFQRRVIYSVPISAQGGDIVEINAQFQITTTKYIGCGFGVILANAANATGGSTLLPFTSQNFTPPGGSDHLVRVGSCAYQFPHAFAGFINVIGYVYNSASPSGSVVVEQGYGGLWVVQNAGEIAPPPPPPPPPPPGVTGGTYSEVGGYGYHTFTANGSLVVTGTKEVEYLVVGPGGAGSGAPNLGMVGGPGGGGEVLTGTLTLADQTLNIALGGRGTAGTSTVNATIGTATTFGNITARPGGVGSRAQSSGQAQPGGNGYSGGGAGWSPTAAAGGVGQNNNNGAGGQAAGTAGGAGGAGGAASGFNGGPGVTVWGTEYGAGAAGTTAGKTSGVVPPAETVPGKGGPGGWNTSGNLGGPGIVIVRYAL